MDFPCFYFFCGLNIVCFRHSTKYLTQQTTVIYMSTFIRSISSPSAIASSTAPESYSSFKSIPESTCFVFVSIALHQARGVNDSEKPCTNRPLSLSLSHTHTHTHVGRHNIATAKQHANQPKTQPINAQRTFSSHHQTSELPASFPFLDRVSDHHKSNSCLFVE